MHILHIDSDKDIDKIEKYIKQGKDIFILIYMVGCGPCNATRPEWSKIESALKEQYEKNDKLVVIDVDKDYIKNIKLLGAIDGFPTMKYIGNYGKNIETYDESSVKKKDRSITSFINWIESKINKVVSTTPTSSAKHVYRRISKKQHGGRKLTHFKKCNNKKCTKKCNNKKCNNKKCNNKKCNNKKCTKKCNLRHYSINKSKIK